MIAWNPELSTSRQNYSHGIFVPMRVAVVFWLVRKYVVSNTIITRAYITYGATVTGPITHIFYLNPQADG